VSASSLDLLQARVHSKGVFLLPKCYQSKLSTGKSSSHLSTHHFHQSLENLSLQSADSRPRPERPDSNRWMDSKYIHLYSNNNQVNKVVFYTAIIFLHFLWHAKVFALKGHLLSGIQITKHCSLVHYPLDLGGNPTIAAFTTTTLGF
jgi:hypothetical protein